MSGDTKEQTLAFEPDFPQVPSSPRWSRLTLRPLTSLLESEAIDFSKVSNIMAEGKTLGHETAMDDQNCAGKYGSGLENWTGKYEFGLDVPTLSTRSRTQEFSEVLRKVFVDRAQTLQVRFVTDTNVPAGLRVRATVVHTDGHLAFDPVVLCPYHAMSFVDQCNVQQSDDDVVYERSPDGLRSSMTFKLFPPYLYKSRLFTFACLGSCSDFNYVRPTAIMFTLEEGARVVGRQWLGFQMRLHPKRCRLKEEKRKNCCVEAKRIEKVQVNSYAGKSRKRKASEVNSAVPHYIRMVQSEQRRPSAPSSRKVNEISDNGAKEELNNLSVYLSLLD